MPTSEIAWRITKKKYAGSAFTGEGARLAGGRYNSPGRAVVYASATLALAQLEILVNLPTERLLGSYVGFRVELPPKEIDTLSREKLPGDWRSNPAPTSVKKLGDQWLESEQGLALKVPSAVVPTEYNYLIRSSRVASGELTISDPFDPRIDPRLR